MTQLREMTERETATVLAALRFWQRMQGASGSRATAPEQLVATNASEYAQLDSDEVDDLCESLNIGELGIRVYARAPSVLLVDAKVVNNDVATGPEYATFSLEPALVARLAELRALVEVHNLDHVNVDCFAMDWGPKSISEALLILHSRLCVSSHSFWFQTWPKHASYQIETAAINFDVLEAAMTDEGWGTVEKPHYCGDHDAMPGVLERYAREAAPGKSTTAVETPAKVAPSEVGGTPLQDDEYELVLDGLQHIRGEKVDALRKAAAAQPSGTAVPFTAESFGIPQLDELLERLGAAGTDLVLVRGR
jgi:hypothetical protein